MLQESHVTGIHLVTNPVNHRTLLSVNTVSLKARKKTHKSNAAEMSSLRRVLSSQLKKLQSIVTWRTLTGFFYRFLGTQSTPTSPSVSNQQIQ